MNPPNSTSAILYDCDSEVQKTIKGEDDEVLRLSQITMQNFRGALSRVELPIHPISFIYGSNGSGKNIGISRGGAKFFCYYFNATQRAFVTFRKIAQSIVFVGVRKTRLARLLPFIILDAT